MAKAFLLEAVDLVLGDGEIVECLVVLVLGAVAIEVEAFDLLAGLAELLGGGEVLFDEVLDSAGFVEFEQRGHLVAFAEQRVVFVAELGVGVAALGEFALQVCALVVGRGELFAAGFERLFEILDLALLAADNVVGDVALLFLVAFEVGDLLAQFCRLRLHHLEVGLERGDLGECAGVLAALWILPLAGDMQGAFRQLIVMLMRGSLNGMVRQYSRLYAGFGIACIVVPRRIPSHM